MDFCESIDPKDKSKEDLATAGKTTHDEIEKKGHCSRIQKSRTHDDRDDGGCEKRRDIYE